MILHEDDDRIIALDNGVNTIKLTNKKSGVTGVMEIDGDTVIFGSLNRMELIHIQGNVVVSCFEHPAGNDDEEIEDEDVSE